MSGIRSFICELPLELPNDLRLIMLANEEIFAKSQNSMGAQSSIQSLLQKLIVGTGAQKVRKADRIFCKIFSVSTFKGTLMQI